MNVFLHTIYSFLLQNIPGLYLDLSLPKKKEKEKKTIGNA
jgi:hypothetical protein